MARIGRYFQKIFGSSAAGSRIAVFGSLADGSPTAYSGATITPDLVQQSSSFNVGLDGCVIANSSPPIQDHNALFYLYSQQLAYLFQEGIPEYDGSTQYYSNSFVQYAGVTYQAIYGSPSGFSGQLPTVGSPYWTTQWIQRQNLPNGSTNVAQSAASTTSIGTGGGPAVIGSVDIVTTGGAVVGLATSSGNPGDFSITGSIQSNDAVAGLNLYVQRDGGFSQPYYGQLADTPLQAGQTLGWYRAASAMAFVETDVPAGSHHYVFYAAYIGGSIGSAVVSANNIICTVYEQR